MNNPAENTGLIGGVEKREISILDHDPNWRTRYETHAKVIAEVLAGVALRIEHVGSTSVPELSAKPIVDMLLVVKQSGDEDSYLSKMEAAGYVLRVREPDFHEHRMFRTPDVDVHIHVFSSQSPEIDRMLIFRDRLRTDAQARQLYEQTKRELATRSWPDVTAYADAKTEVIEGIIAAAQAAGSPRVSGPVSD